MKNSVRKLVKNEVVFRRKITIPHGAGCIHKERMTSLPVFEEVLASREMKRGAEEEVLDEEDVAEDLEDTEDEIVDDDEEDEE
ncbi:MAG: hypothetical protein HYS73_00215 [Parcubacteria group bacterium]|nr:hypothetical protein [Parcubacteria group bacterium]